MKTTEKDGSAPGQRQAHIVVNPNARQIRRSAVLAREIDALAQGRARVWLTPDLPALKLAAREIMGGDPSLVVLCGGDGTFMATISALERVRGEKSLPPFALAPAGTVATVARNWGQRRPVLEVVERALGGALGPTPFPSLRVRERGGEERVGFTVGTGLVARFFERYYRAGGAGYRTALSIVLRIFAGSLVGDRYARSVLDPLPCKLTVDGIELSPNAYSLVVCSVLRDLGLHMLVTHRAAEDPARPHLVASSLPTRQLGPQAPRVALGMGLRGSGGFDGLVDEFSVEFPDSRGPYVLDGDMFHASALTVSAGPVIRIAR